MSAAGRARRGVVALLLVLTACGGDGAPPAETGTAPTSGAPEATTTTTEPAPVDGMLASIDVSRLFVLEHAMGLGLQNVGDLTRTVVQIQIESNLFETVPPADERVVLTPGLRELVMPVPYGAPTCDQPGAAAAFTAVVRFEDGAELRLPAPPRHAGTIERLHERECAAADIRDRVALRFGEVWTQEGTSVLGDLVLEQRHPGPPVAVTDISGSVIFGFVSEEGPPLVAVADDEPVAAVAVEISAARCDPHGLSEAKRAFVFVVWLSVDGEEAVAIDLPVEGPARAALDVLVAECLGG